MICNTISAKYMTGGYKIYRTCFRHGDTMGHEMFIYDPINIDGSHTITGNPEGFVIHIWKIITLHATCGKFYVKEV